MIKKLLAITLCIFVFAGCHNNKTAESTETKVHESQLEFMGTVRDIHNSTVTVEPLPGEDILRSADRVSFNTNLLEDVSVTPGCTVRVIYTGDIMESYPVQINAISWSKIENLQDMAYPHSWITKSDSAKTEDNYFTDVIITAIYADCFFARSVVPLPYTIKVNTSLNDKWCVGDQVAITYENTYLDQENYRYEADLLTIKESDFQIQEGVCYKPVIYLYPEQEAKVNVQLDLNGALTCTYPKYNNGWEVTADPDGSLTDNNGQTYNYLYWEGDIVTSYDFSKGFCVPGKDTAHFLETVLPKLGLNRKEANEFIVYWLPLMEQNPYNLITFQTRAYTDAAQLQISPAPDSIIRIFMAWQGSDKWIQIEEPVLITPERTGFTVVEWGGTEVK